ncbi:Exodeoxyribonuclease 7 small subunit [Oceanibacterium hippocampi]|uniref:Exodeoxyribonuclease 7 small subunit n=2 Tax=Oceanibacterium hippocampi TaxID=745714 RepID=A0A1Y5U084_9PROT|nr:exodeoxyribonuclease VII small subunit [Oceanibacterium hippocampi]SLN72911.1 Exodeoxyribonuclease 7 small subunit [Oceanibacterium hippocampi]
MTENAQNPIASMSFEAALAELETIVRDLERGDIPLEDSIEAYARGTALRKHCQERLNAAEERVEKIVAGTGENTPARTEPFDPA